MSTTGIDALNRGTQRPLRDHAPQHFLWEWRDGIAHLTLNRPERKNPLTFDSYAELRDTFTALRSASDVRAVVLAGSGDNFCSGGDVHDIIGPLVAMSAPELLRFTRMTGDLVRAMRACPQPIVAAIDGVCGQRATGEFGDGGENVHVRRHFAAGAAGRDFPFVSEDSGDSETAFECFSFASAEGLGRTAVIAEDEPGSVV